MQFCQVKTESPRPLLQTGEIFSVEKTFYQSLSDCSLYKTGTQAACACIYSARSTVNDSLYLLNVGLECSVAASVGVRHLNAECYALAADFALCHL